MTRWLVISLVALGPLLPQSTRGQVSEPPPVSSVGMARTIPNLVLPGTELAVKPLADRKEKVVVRITNCAKHGTAYRYDLEYYGLEPGSYDLRDYLERKDGSATGDLPAIPVKVESLLPKGQIVPHDPLIVGGPRIGGYRKLLILAAAGWALGMLAILFWKRSRPADDAKTQARPASLADRLRPLVERGCAGELSATERADLERTLIAFWRRRLDLKTQKPAEAIAALKAHPDAGPLLVQLETWLHQPKPSHDVDVGAILRPYQNLPANALDAPGGRP